MFLGEEWGGVNPNRSNKSKKGDEILERMRTFAPQTRLVAEPNISASQVAVIPPDTELDAFEQVDRYRRVSFVDDQGHSLTGYVNSNFLVLVGADRERVKYEEPVAAIDNWFETKGPRFDRTTGWLAAGLVLVLFTNMLTSVILWYKIKMLPPPIVHTSCSGVSSYSLAPLNWASNMNHQILRPGAQVNDVEVSLAFDLRQKEPGSEIKVLYGPRNTSDWQQVVAAAVGPLSYEVNLELDASQSWVYRIAEAIGGEITRLSESEGYIPLAATTLTNNLFIEVLDSGEDEGKQLQLRFWRLPKASQDIKISYIEVEFYAEHPYLEQASDHAVTIRQPVDLGAGRGLVYELSTDRDDAWQHVRVTVTMHNGHVRYSQFSFQELFLGRDFPIDNL